MALSAEVLKIFCSEAEKHLRIEEVREFLAHKDSKNYKKSNSKDVV